jgi:hypothetical protein
MITRPLRAALAANLIFSTACAVALLVAGPDIARAMGALPGWAMTGLGAMLLAFAACIGLVLWRLRIGFALLISVLDFLWVATTLPLVLVPDLLSLEGKIVVIFVAAAVGLFGLLQARGIRAMLGAGREGDSVYRHCVKLDSPASPEILWRAVRDLGGIARHAPGLKSSRITDGTEPAPGATRVCEDHQGRRWEEEVVSLDDATRSVELRFKTEAEGFPFPFDSMRGGWTVHPNAMGGSAIEVWWTVRPRARRLGWMLLALMAIPLDRDIRRIVASMESDGSTDSNRAARRLPGFSYC